MNWEGEPRKPTVLQKSPRRRAWSREPVRNVTILDVCGIVIAVVLVWAKLKGWG